MSDRELDPGDWDPVFIHSRREAVVIVLTWVVALLWTVPYCCLNGYLGTASTDPSTFIIGMPAWVFWGIAVPWLVADVVAIWFCFAYFVDDDLGAAAEEQEADSEKEAV